MAARRQLTRGQRFGAWASKRWTSPTAARLRSPGMIVFLTGAYLSYWHIVEVAHRPDLGDQGSLAARLYPVAIDAMIIVAAKYITHSKTRVGRVVAVGSFALGAIMTVGCNLLSAAPTTIGRLIAVVPAVTVVAVAIMLHWGEMKPRTINVTVRNATERAAVLAALKAHRAGRPTPAPVPIPVPTVMVEGTDPWGTRGTVVPSVVTAEDTRRPLRVGTVLGS